MIAGPFAAGAVLLAVAFSCCTYERWWARRRPQDLAWTIAMALFALAAAAFALAVATGWSSWSFRVFYLLGGILTVPVLALGTVYLLCPRRLADRLAIATALAGAFAAGVVATAPFKITLAAHRLNEGREVFGVGPRALAAVGSGLGAVVVIGGALWSAVLLLRRSTLRARPLAVANLLIALGTVLISFKRPFVELTGSDETGFALALSVGLAVIFSGFLTASATRRDALRQPSMGRSSRRTSLPTTPSGSRSTNSILDGHL